MTNAEKYLKDGETGNFVQAFSCWYYGITRELENADKMLVQFLKEQAKPTLTEDERVILRNIKGYTTIIRNAENNIQVENEDGSFACLCAFNHLFQFIKERRRIRDSRTFERRIEMIKYFCDKCGKISEKDELHQVYPDLMSKEHIDLCENCFQEYAKEMQVYIDNINKAEEERQEAIKKYFALRDLYDEQE